jgi:hypothetical protein
MGKISGYSVNNTPVSSDYILGETASGPTTNRFQISKLPIETTNFGSSWAWTTWTPTYQNITVGNGTVVAKYTQIGKLVTAKFFFTLGSTSSVGSDPRFSLPVAPTLDYIQGASMGVMTVQDVSSGSYWHGNVWYYTNAGVYYGWPIVALTSGAYSQSSGLTSTVPFGAAFATGDYILCTISYEAA